MRVLAAAEYLANVGTSPNGERPYEGADTLYESVAMRGARGIENQCGCLGEVCSAARRGDVQPRQHENEMRIVVGVEVNVVLRAGSSQSANVEVTSPRAELWRTVKLPWF